MTHQNGICSLCACEAPVVLFDPFGLGSRLFCVDALACASAWGRCFGTEPVLELATTDILPPPAMGRESGREALETERMR